MLSLLHIENIAVIESADIAFAEGFNVLTGETGAGKSIVIDAISAIIGERTYRDVIRTGASKAFVSAMFLRIPELPWFAENHIPYDSELLIQRELSLDGKNVCRVNGQPVTVAILKQLGGQLINIHGQHDSQQLFDEENHLRYLDLFAHNDALRERYASCYGSVCSIRREMERLSMDESEKLRRTEMLQHQIQEIERAQLKPGEDEALEGRRKLLQNAEKFASGMESALQSLYGDEQTDGASAMLSDAEYALGKIARYDPRIDQLHGRVADLMYSAQELSEELRQLRDEMSFSPDELEQLEARLDVIHRLRRKYGADVQEILAYLAKAQAELDEIEFAGDRLEQLKKQLSAAQQQAEAAALALRESRKQTAQALQARIRTELAQLDMPRVQFVCEFSEVPLSPSGMDQVRFLMSANTGEALKPMSKVASGGELARIMLAMKNVLAEQDAVPTLIFDEVDAGVSGRAAQKVANKLASVAASKQVLCVTHLPQIAAMADQHLLISKREAGGRTYTSIQPLDLDGRTNEIARIIGGEIITDTTRESAREMLLQKNSI